MQVQQEAKGVPKMSASELVDHWQAEVDKLLDVRCGFRISDTNMDSGRKWKSNEADQYALYQKWANVNGWPTQPMDTWDKEFDAAQEKLEAAKLDLQKRTGAQTNASFFPTAGSDSGDMHWDSRSGLATMEVEDTVGSDNVATSASLPGWASRVQESLTTLLGRIKGTPREVVDDSVV